MRSTDWTLCFGTIATTTIAVMVIIDAGMMLTASATTTMPPSQNFSDYGTDPDLEAIFIGRCADYKAGKVNPTADSAELRMKNCTHLWNLFSSTFRYQDPCDVNQTMYEEFVAEASITIPINKSTFWDGWDIYDTVRSYANEGKRSWTLEYSLMGYLINNLKFCGQEGEPGLKYDSCPAADECGFGKGSGDAFWAEASTNFGKQAKGQVRLFLNSNRPGGAFQNENSYFAQYELINMPSDTVENVNIYLVTQLETNTGDDCTSQSIQELTGILSDRSIHYTCHDQPRDVLHLLCVDGNGSQECLLEQDALESPTDVALPSTTGAASRNPTISIGFNFLALMVFLFTLRVLHHT